MTTKAKTKKPKIKTAEDLLVERVQAEVARIRKEKGVSPEVAASEAALDAEAAALFKQTNGSDNATKLDAAEAIGRIERDGGPAFDRIGTWKPPMQVDPADLLPLAAVIAEARAQVETLKLKNMTDPERQLYALEQQQASIIAADKAKAEHVTRLADPKVKTALEKLRKLDSETALSEDWTYSETVAIARAIVAIETQGSDLTAALALADAAFAINTGKKLAARTAHEKEIARLQAELDAEKATTPADETSVATKTTDPPASESSADELPSIKTWNAWQALKASPDATHAAVEAAGKAWHDSLKTPITDATGGAAKEGATSEGAAT